MSAEKPFKNAKLPLPEEYGEICSDPSKAMEFHSQLEHLIPLAERFILCENCNLVDSQKSNCYCSDGCYLQELGLLNIENSQSVSSLISYLSRYFCYFTKTYTSFLRDSEKLKLYKEFIDGEAKRLKHDEEKLAADEKKLAEDEKVFMEKKSKLGRPSNFENRRLMYEVYYAQANPKPSFRALGKKFDPPISASQVIRDLERLGLLDKSEGSRGKQEGSMDKKEG